MENLEKKVSTTLSAMSYHMTLGFKKEKKTVPKTGTNKPPSMAVT